MTWLTWDEVLKLPDRASIYIHYPDSGPSACVLRWDYSGLALEVTACVCVFDPATMDDTLVLFRFTKRRFEQRSLKIRRREE